MHLEAASLKGERLPPPRALRADWGVRWPFNLRTILFGCRIEVLAGEGLASLFLGETVLAFVESFLATSGMGKRQLSARAELRVELVARDDAGQPFEYELVEDDAGEVKIVVAHPKGPVRVVGETYIRRMMDLLAQVLGQLWMPMRMEDLDALFAEERAQDRASLTAQLPVVYGGLLGQGAKVEAKDWMALGTESLALRRSAPWQPAADASPTGAEDGADGTRRDRPVSGADAGRHRDMKVLSVLNLPVWDAARWKGLAYTFARGPDDVPEVVRRGCTSGCSYDLQLSPPCVPLPGLRPLLLSGPSPPSADPLPPSLRRFFAVASANSSIAVTLPTP